MMDINSDLNTKRSSEYKNITDGESLPLLLTVADVQRILRLSKTSVGYLIHQKDFPVVQLSARKYIIPRDLLLQWLNSQAMH